MTATEIITKLREHQAEAEHLLLVAYAQADPEFAQHNVAQAQVHAMLAQSYAIEAAALL